MMSARFRKTKRKIEQSDETGQGKKTYEERKRKGERDEQCK